MAVVGIVLPITAHSSPSLETMRSSRRTCALSKDWIFRGVACRSFLVQTMATACAPCLTESIWRTRSRQPGWFGRIVQLRADPSKMARSPLSSIRISSAHARKIMVPSSRTVPHDHLTLASGAPRSAKNTLMLKASPPTEFPTAYRGWQETARDNSERKNRSFLRPWRVILDVGERLETANWRRGWDSKNSL